MAERTDLFYNTYGHFVEGEERFESLQKFFDAVHRLTTERRLSRIFYPAERPAA
jgi:hypothetical protein